MHFFRHPLRRSISGYRYHRDASESWCRFPQAYAETCSPPRPTGDFGPGNGSVGLQEVRRFCKGTHLCQACCRREHEQVESKYALRSLSEYAYLCRHLGSINGSLAESLQRLPWERGVLLEAALDYFESLRMASIVNRTWTDPRSLHVDIDCLRADFAGSVRAILRHIGFSDDEAEVRGTVEELRFFDLDRSPIYRWSVSNPLFQHVSGASAGSQELMERLLRDEEVQHMYGPVLAMMDPALGTCKSLRSSGG